ncbi:MAG: NAD(P)-dependent oxidoreductase [Leptolyngbya sp. SIO1D8]|nr:NAD(P)-dependent oxidoreductase [Leptolyngbya sp. SIO1D8]
MQNSVQNKRVIISGANGYFGLIAQAYFGEQGWQVLKASRHADADIPFDLDQPEKSAATKLGAAADVFIHAAAAHEVTCRQAPYRSIYQNVAGTRAALDFCVVNGISKFVYLSTFHVFGSPQGPIDETTTPSPSNDYGLTNRLAEEYVNLYTRQGKIQGMVVRPSNFFGIPADIHQCHRWTLTPLAFCREAVEQKKIVLRTPGHQERNFISIWDLCGAIQAGIEKISAYPLLNVAGPDTLSIRELAQCVQSAMRRCLNQEIELIIPDGPKPEESFTYTSLYLDQLYRPQHRIDTFIENFCSVLANQPVSVV